MDQSILRFVTQLNGRMPRFDELVILVAQNDLVKGGLIVALLWWYWFKPAAAQDSRREIIVACVIAALAAALASRLFAHAVMVHQRPFMIPELHFPHRPNSLWEDKASSLPSDHAALALGLVTGLFFISRRVGLAMGLYAFALICLPRVYLGIHWPSDILAGSALGIGSAVLLCHRSVRSRLAGPAIQLSRRSPHAFYALAFIVSFGLMTRFDSARSLYSWVTSIEAPGARTLL